MLSESLDAFSLENATYKLMVMQLQAGLELLNTSATLWNWTEEELKLIQQFTQGLTKEVRAITAEKNGIPVCWHFRDGFTASKDHLF